MPSSRVRRGRAFWESAVRDHAGSGLTQVEFSLDRGLCTTTLQRWRARLGYTRGEGVPVETAESPAAPAVEFVRVVPVGSRQIRSAEAAATPEIQTVELHIAAGARLRCAVGTDPRWLADLVVACQRAAC